MIYLTKIDAARNMARLSSPRSPAGPVWRLGAGQAFGRDRPGPARSAAPSMRVCGEGATPAALERELRRRKRRGYAAAL